MSNVPIVKKSAPGTATSLQTVQARLNPFALNNEQISANIIGCHDTKAVRQDVDPLYNIVSDIVKHANAPQVGERPDLKVITMYNQFNYVYDFKLHSIINIVVS